MTIINALPFTLQNGTTADATQVQADLQAIVDDVNNNAAGNGVNTDITALTALTTPLTPAQGGASVFTASVTSTGTANAQVVANPSPTGFALVEGYRLTFTAGFTNTGATTLNANSTGVTAILRQTPSGLVALAGGEIVAGSTTDVQFDGTQFVLLNNIATTFLGALSGIAGAATVDLGAAPNHWVAVTGGPATISSFGSSASTVYPLYKVIFGGVFTLTYNATSMILIGSTSIVTANGDTAEFTYQGSGNWRMVSFSRINGTSLQFNAAFLQGYINGLTLSTAGGSGTMGIAAGIAADSTNAAMMPLNSAYTKTTASWALGTGNGGLDTGAIANSTWYHWYEIQRPDTGVVDIIFSLSASAPTLPANYTLYRRIGSAKTDGSAQWTLFTQTGDTFIWSTSVNDGTTAGTSRASFTLTVPTGIVVNALARTFTEAGGENYVLFTSLQEADQNPFTAIPDLAQAASGKPATANVERFTNTSAQIGHRASAAGVAFRFYTYGWVDRRGKS